MINTNCPVVRVEVDDIRYRSGSSIFAVWESRERTGGER